MNRLGLLQQPFLHFDWRLIFQEFFAPFAHSIKCPKQVHRRRSTGCEVGGYFAQSFFNCEFVFIRFLQSDNDAVGCSDANCWSTTNSQHLDCFPYCLHVTTLQPLELGG